MIPWKYTAAQSCFHFVPTQHDSGAVCTPGESGGSGGNYIMYARATTGKEKNNIFFSPCSIANMSRVLEAKKDNCFVGKLLNFILHGYTESRRKTYVGVKTWSMNHVIIIMLHYFVMFIDVSIYFVFKGR